MEMVVLMLPTRPPYQSLCSSNGLVGGKCFGWSCPGVYITVPAVHAELQWELMDWTHPPSEAEAGSTGRGGGTPRPVELVAEQGLGLCPGQNEFPRRSLPQLGRTEDGQLRVKRRFWMARHWLSQPRSPAPSREGFCSPQGSGQEALI